MLHIHHIRSMVALAMLALFTACATIHGPQTTEDKIQYAKASLTVVYKTISNLAVRGRITKDEANKLLLDANTVENAIKQAEDALEVLELSAAQGKIDLAMQALMMLEKHLQEKKK